jgi:serine/threonine protein kinase
VNEGDAQALIGRTIAGKFRIEAYVGGGGMGAVYKARQVDLDKIVAIKVLHAALAYEPAFATRFKREAKAASRIDHPNSMRVLDFGQEADGLFYIAMEFLEGRNLHRIIHEEGPLDAARLAGFARQTLAALTAAHELKIVHRDLKPENIIVLRRTDDEGNAIETVKVCDFGIAKFTAPAPTQTTTNQKLTHEGSLIGTPDYMSPEQARGLELDARSDLYSVGVILYEALTGKLPFVADTPLAVVLRHINDEPKPPHELVPGVDPKLEAICLRAMAKKPEERYASAREMRAALATESAPLRSNPPPPLVPPTPAKLLLVPSESTSTPGMAAPASTAPMPEREREREREPRGSAMATLMADSVRPPMSPLPRVALIALALGVAVGGGFLWMRGRARGASAPSAQASPVPTVEPTPTAADPHPPAGVVPDLPPPAPTVPAAAPPGVPPKAGAPLLKAASHATVATKPGAPPAPAEIAPPPATPAPPPAPPPSPATTAPVSGAHVVVGQITASNASSGDVANALPIGRFNRCYREGITGQAAPLRGQMTLHIEVTTNETKTAGAAPPALAGVAQCIATAAKSVSLASGATADIELTFKPD